MMKKIAIFGTSGFAFEVADIAREIGHIPVFIGNDEIEISKWEKQEDIISEKDIEKISNLNFIIGIGENSIRKKIAETYKEKLNFVNLIHPSATFGKNQIENILGKRGVIVCAGVRFTNNIKIGNFTIFNLNTTIGHDCNIEDFVNISPGANISGNVYIQSGSLIGTGATVNQGTNQKKLTIECDSVIGSGALVTKDCESGGIYKGVPAKKTN